jgi:hypothetical protein
MHTKNSGSGDGKERAQEYSPRNPLTAARKIMESYGRILLLGLLLNAVMAFAPKVADADPPSHRGLDRGCIDTEYWDPVMRRETGTKIQGCWVFEPEFGIQAEDGVLSLVPTYKDPSATNPWYGIHTMIDHNMTISLTIEIDDIENYLLRIGIDDAEGDQPGDEYFGLIFLRYSDDKIRWRVYSTEGDIEDDMGTFEKSRLQDVTIVFSDETVDIRIKDEIADEVVFTAIPHSIENPRFHIYYAFLNNDSNPSRYGKLKAYLSNLTFGEKGGLGSEAETEATKETGTQGSEAGSEAIGETGAQGGEAETEAAENLLDKVMPSGIEQWIFLLCILGGAGILIVVLIGVVIFVVRSRGK